MRNSLSTVPPPHGEAAGRGGLSEREAMLQEFLDDASDLITSVDADLRYAYVNRAFCETLGYTRDEAQGLAALDVVHRDHRDEYEEVLASLFRDGAPKELEIVLVTKDGRSLLVEGKLNARLEGGRPAAARGFFRDVTARHEMEESLRKSRDDLSLANAQLARAARLKDEFLASISHELRTPLTGILNLTEALLEEVFGTLEPPQVKCLRSVEHGGRHLLGLINDILDLSKLEAGQIELAIEPCSVEDICQSSLQLVKGMAQKKRQVVHYRLDSAFRSMHADGRRVKQILVNLLGNAVKFTPEGGNIGLEVSGDIAANVVRFTVWDSGIGIAHDDLPRIFEPFTQLDSSLSRQHAGTGLGLSLAQRMADLHGGSITVESAPGRGSRFVVSLAIGASSRSDPPRASNRPPSSRSISRSHDAPASSRSNTDRAVSSRSGGRFGASVVSLRPKGKLVLVVDDNETNVETYRDYLEAKGFAVAVARNGEEAVEATATLRPAAVLMDVQMPGMDGIEATRRIRALENEAIAKTPIIALTALAMPGDRERCLGAGADEYLSKPVSLRALVEAIESRVDRA